MPGRKAPEERRREEILRAAFAVAARDRLPAVTARAVAAEAGVSSGLVFFHFDSIDKLLVELLDWMLVRASNAIGREPTTGDSVDPGERLMAAVGRDIGRLPRERERVEVFFDFWVLGARHPVIRRRLRTALDRYRSSFVELSKAAVDADPERYAGITPEGLATVAASFVQGSALQIVLHPAEFDVRRSVATLAALVRHPVPALAFAQLDSSKNLQGAAP